MIIAIIIYPHIKRQPKSNQEKMFNEITVIRIHPTLYSMNE